MEISRHASVARNVILSCPCFNSMSYIVKNVLHRKDAKALIAKAVNDELRDLRFWIFFYHSLDVASDLLFVFFLQLEGVDAGFELLEFGVGVVFKLDYPAQARKFLMMLAHKLQITFARRIRAFDVPRKPGRQMATAQLKEGRAVKILVHLHKNRLWQPQDVLLPVAAEEFF